MAWAALNALLLSQSGDYSPLPVSAAGGEITVRIPAFAAGENGIYEVGIYAGTEQNPAFIAKSSVILAPYQRYLRFSVPANISGLMLGLKLIDHDDLQNAIYELVPEWQPEAALGQFPGGGALPLALTLEQVTGLVSGEIANAYATYAELAGLTEGIESAISAIALQPGPKGDTGDVGPKGDTGDVGPKGDTGDVGPKGDTGDVGPKGDTGDVGPKGDTGPAGPPGESLVLYSATAPIDPLDGQQWRELGGAGEPLYPWAWEWRESGPHWISPVQSVQASVFRSTAVPTLTAVILQETGWKILLERIFCRFTATDTTGGTSITVRPRIVNSANIILYSGPQTAFANIPSDDAQIYDVRLSSPGTFFFSANVVFAQIALVRPAGTGVISGGMQWDYRIIR